ncbi:MAG: hypothetical protein P4L43_00620 [Syntrophobacteraceae bacterium]|nr:hypothetical protein [Syntrophobacteraceae bacterium]
MDASQSSGTANQTLPPCCHCLDLPLIQPNGKVPDRSEFIEVNIPVPYLLNHGIGTLKLFMLHFQLELVHLELVNQRTDIFFRHCGRLSRLFPAQGLFGLAAQVAGLILSEGTVKKIRDGSQIVSKTGGEFSRITESASKMSELIGEISAEQAQGIEEINKAVSRMDKVVQQNASTAEESASAAEEMNAQARRLRNFVFEMATLAGLESNGAAAGERSEPQSPPKSLLPKPIGKTLPPLARSAAEGKTFRNGNGKNGARNGKLETEPSRVLPLDDSELEDF